jgi:hypothetical protein
MKILKVYKAVEFGISWQRILGNVLAQDGPNALTLARQFWPLATRIRVERVSLSDAETS